MALKGTNQEVGRPFNRRIVLEAIRLGGPIARTEIASRVGLTVQTVSTIVRELEEQELVLSIREAPVGRGVPPSKLMVNPGGGHAIGIQITPLAISGALINMGGEMLASVRRDAPQAGPDEAFVIIGDIISNMKARNPGKKLLGAGMAMPGPFGVDSMSFVGSTTMTGWHGTDIRARLEEVAGMPAFLEIDMAAAALGEELYGYGTELTDYYYLFFGVGLGGTMVQDGSALRGHWGNAGEIGHLTVVPDGIPCACGNRGCLERYVSLEALQQHNIPEEDWIAEIAPIFARAVRAIENLFDPQAVILGGIAPPRLLARLAATAASMGNSVSVRKDRRVPRLLVARGGQNSVLRGAAALAVHGVLAPHSGLFFSNTHTANGYAGEVHG